MESIKSPKFTTDLQIWQFEQVKKQNEIKKQTTERQLKIKEVQK
jgi:hypothetical protein